MRFYHCAILIAFGTFLACGGPAMASVGYTIRFADDFLSFPERDGGRGSRFTATLEDASFTDGALRTVLFRLDVEAFVPMAPHITSGPVRGGMLLSVRTEERHGGVWIQADGAGAGVPVEFQLVDVTGRVLERSSMVNANGAMLPTDALPSGMYLAVARCNGQVASEKIQVIR